MAAPPIHPVMGLKAMVFIRVDTLAAPIWACKDTLLQAAAQTMGCMEVATEALMQAISVELFLPQLIPALIASLKRTSKTSVRP